MAVGFDGKQISLFTIEVPELFTFLRMSRVKVQFLWLEVIFFVMFKIFKFCVFFGLLIDFKLLICQFNCFSFHSLF